MNLGHLAQDADPLGPVVDGFELRVQRADQLAEVARPPVDRLEDDGDAVALGVRARQRLQRRDGVRLAGRPLQDLRVAVDRRGRGRPASRAGSAPAAAGRRRARARRVMRSSVAGQVIGQLVPLPLGASSRSSSAAVPRSAGSTSIASRSVPIARPRLSSFSSSSFALRRSSASFAAGSTARPASSSISSRSSCQAPQRSSAASNSCATSRSSGRASNSRR